MALFMERRLFIAINLPEDIKAEIRHVLQLDDAKNAELYSDAKMVPEENWHITLKFLGNQSKEHLATIERVIADIAKGTHAPEVAIRTLTTAPPHRPPRMVWVTTTTETNKTLGSIKETMEAELERHNIFHQKGEVHPVYHGHINLARLPEGRRIADHIVSLPNALTFKPATIDLMESQLENSGAEYSIVRSIDFKTSI